MSVRVVTDEQIREAMLTGVSMNALAKATGVNRRTLDRRKAALVKKGYSPEHGMIHEAPDGFYVKGVSTMHKTPEGLPQWVKTNIDHERQLELMQEAIANITSEVRPVDKVEYTGIAATDKLFSVFPIGDPHIGLLTWAKEVNTDWDINIADRVYRKVFQRLLSMMPVTNEAVLINTGDFFHADNVQGETARSGHRLNLDGRHGKWIDAGIAVIRMFVETLLARYEKVHYVNVTGNHDDILGRFMGSFVENMYQANPRITCQKGDNPFQYLIRGKVLLGFAHGHTTKLARLPGKMADDVPELWGRSIYRHWITGHVHHNQFVQFKEHPGCSVESVGIIPPKDAYSHGGAYGARRGTQGLIFDAEHGELALRVETNVRKGD
jgi:UDP-2,3-diacylglucosamine pyrophosphatase LpxH